VEQDGRAATLSERNHFLIRRLHSLTGIVPVGVFLCFHLLANSTILFGGEHFQESVQRIHLLEPFLEVVEVVLIFIPILFHTLIGFQIIFSGRWNTQQYRYGGNIRYMLQRVTGVIAILFILFHVWQLHWLGAPFGGGAFLLYDNGAPSAAVSTAKAIRGYPDPALWVAPFYALGIVSAVFHFANGIWTALITWGITIGPRSQKLSGRVCVFIGIVLGLVGLGALSGFRRMDVSTADAPTAAQDPATGVGQG
jgi:succinate dehydrogenase / fumarate reductase cytochrome b subunit